MLMIWAVHGALAHAFLAACQDAALAWVGHDHAHPCMLTSKDQHVPWWHTEQVWSEMQAMRVRESYQSQPRRILMVLQSMCLNNGRLFCPHSNLLASLRLRARRFARITCQQVRCKEKQATKHDGFPDGRPIGRAAHRLSMPDPDHMHSAVSVWPPNFLMQHLQVAAEELYNAAYVF
jgi:hypothetical protein